MTSMESSFNRVGIIGVGLIGGSLGLAIKKSVPQTRVLGLGRDEARLRLAKEMGAVDEFNTDHERTLRFCDLVILATPVEHVLSTLETLGGFLAPGTVVTDAGSTKRKICRLAWACLPKAVQFIGGHPIAGREVTGVENSLAGLFEKAPYVLCPQPGIAPDNFARLKSLVEALGAHAVVMTPEDHDRAIARVSHMPQLLSTALANITDFRDVEISGSGLRDMLRLAGSSYSVWKGILTTNADNIELALEDFIKHLQAVQTYLRAERLSEEFERAQECYQRIKPPKP
jgi:prephenate dehydrogenase